MNEVRRRRIRLVVLALAGGVILQAFFAKHRVIVKNGASGLTDVRLRVQDHEIDIGPMAPTNTKEARLPTSAQEGALYVVVARESGSTEEQCAYATRLPRLYVVHVETNGIRCQTVGPWPFF